MAHVVALSNQKGGVGKTTTAVSLSAQIALLGFRVLLIDLDPQCSATSGTGVAKNPEGADLYDLFFGRVALGSLITETAVPNLSVVPGSSDLVSLELELGKTPGRELILKSAISEIDDQFDVVFIDCPPSSGLLTLNAMGAAPSVLVPLQAEYYSLEGISGLMNTISFVQQTFNPRLDVIGVVLTMFDARTNLAMQVYEEAARFFGPKLFKARIPRNIRLSECPSHGMPICTYDPQSTGAKSYLALAGELMDRLALGKEEEKEEKSDEGIQAA